MKLKKVYLTICISFLLLSCSTNSKLLSIEELKVEGKNNPIGLDVLEPKLSWQLKSSKNNTSQVAYRIIAAKSIEDLQQQKNILWDTKKIDSDQSQQISYKGNPLKDYADVYWKVMIWTNHADSVWSGVNHWNMAMLSDRLWNAKWIGIKTTSNSDRVEDQDTRLAARYLRKLAKIQKDIASAKVYISGLGLYELSINGEKVGEDVLAPAATDYKLRVPYNTYDVTKQLSKGENALAIVLGNGRFFHMRDFKSNPNPITGIIQVNYGFPRLLFQMRITYKDGSEELIVSDESWKATDLGPIRANNEYDGEEYDARMELTGWNKKDFDDSNWKAADLMDRPEGLLFSQLNENIKVKEIIKPKELYKTKKGTYILDIGQNMVGWLKFKLKANSGDSIKMVFSERRQSRDSLYLANLRTAKVTDTYVFKSNDVEEWNPIFTYHGFQYVEIIGLKEEPALDAFEAHVVYDDVKTIGTFESSDKTLNQIFSNAYWTIRSNYRGIPTDCPQRDERVAWLGDRIMSSYGESFIFDNSRLYAKWMADVSVAQKENGSIPDVVPAFWLVQNDNVTYPSAFIIIPEMLRKQYADEHTFKQYYPQMKKWMEYMWSTYQENGLILKDVYGDWCVAPGEGTNVIWTNDPKRTTNGGLVAASYYYYCLTLMKNFAKIQGLSQDVQHFEDRSILLKQAFNKRFFKKDSLYYDNNTTTANLLPLTFGLVNESDRDAVFQRIVEKTKEYGNHIHTGIMGAMWYMRGLSDHGRPDLAFTVATQKTYPSWGYMIENGATTIWELWNGNTGDPLMNSWNHQMLLGDLLIWYYEYLAGIKSDTVKTGFKEIIMNPIFPDGLDYVNASYQSIYGEIKSQWNKNVKTKLQWKVSIPANSNAIIHLPSKNVSNVKVDGKELHKLTDIKLIDNNTENLVIYIGSGIYNIEVLNPNY